MLRSEELGENTLIEPSKDKVEDKSSSKELGRLNILVKKIRRMSLLVITWYGIHFQVKR
jgi:hypothetical protein